MIIFRRFAAVSFAALLCAPALALASGKPVTVVVPFAPGGSSDIVARLVVPKLTERLKQPVVVDNRPGANGAIGAALVARAQPDGNTLLIGSVGTFVINPILMKSVSYGAKDFDLLTVAVRTPNVIVVPASLPVNNVAELVAHMKKSGGKTTFASAGNGSTDHLTAVLFWQKTGTTGVHVPYKGAGAAISDLLAGHVDAMISNVGLLASYIQSGKLKALAVTSDKRISAFPSIPTLAEAGYKDLVVYSWQGIVAPKGLAPASSATLQEALIGALKDASVKKHLDDLGYEVVAGNGDDFGKTMAAETARWKSVISSSNIQLE